MLNLSKVKKQLWSRTWLWLSHKKNHEKGLFLPLLNYLAKSMYATFKQNLQVKTYYTKLPKSAVFLPGLTYLHNSNTLKWDIQ